MSKQKILLALFRMPYPATDGTRYKILNNVAGGLLKDFDVEFFVVSIKPVAREDVEYLERNFGKVHLFCHSKFAYGMSAIPAFFSGLPLQAEAFRFRDAQAWLDAHIGDYDAVYIHEIRMTEFFIRYSGGQKKRFLVDFNDAISMSYAEGHQKMRFPENLFYHWEGNRVARYEAKVLASFFHFNIVSEADRAYLLKGLHIDDFSVIAHGSPISEQVALLDEDKIFFMGSMDYEPNRDALDYFLKNIWPMLHAHLPSLELLVVGGGHVPGTYRRVSGVSFAGFVPSVFEAVRHCKALVAPIRYAGGTPSKILDAMGYGIPVLTTPQAVAGIGGAVPGTNVLTVAASDIGGWVTTIQKVVTDDALRSALSKNARQLILETYSAPVAEDAFRKRFHGIIKS